MNDMKIFKLLFVLPVLLLLTIPQFTKACVNDGSEDYAHYIPQKFLASSEVLNSIKLSMSKSPQDIYNEKYLAGLEAASPENKEDQALLEQQKALKELLTGEPSKAIEMLLEIEEENPGQYVTASNLGTAYELNGENEKALKWIKEGINRNAESHYGTEWLHALILEAKINLEKDPAYYDNRHILNLPATLPIDSTDAVLVYDGKDITEINLRIALAYQLKERVVFIKPKDTVVADLLFALATITKLNLDRAESIEFLNLSKEYGFKNTLLWETTYAEYNADLERRNSRRNSTSKTNDSLILPVVFSLILGIPILLLLFRKKKKHPA